MGKYSTEISKILQAYPELKKLEEVPPTGMHYTDAYHHTLDALSYADDLLTELETINPDPIRHDYMLAFQEFLSDYLSWLEEAFFMRKEIYLIEDTSIDDFVVDGEPMFFDYIERVGYGPEDATTAKGLVLISLVAGHLTNLSMISDDREILFSRDVYEIKCPHTLELNSAIDPILPDPKKSLHTIALHDIGKIIKNQPGGLASCHDRAGFSLAGRLSKRFFTNSGKSDIERMVLNHHILPRTKSYRKFAVRFLDVVKYGHRLPLLSDFYLMRISDLMAHNEEARPIIHELFKDFMNLPAFAAGETLVACPIRVISRYSGLSIPSLTRAFREHVLAETFRQGIGNELLFEIFYSKKVVLSK